MQVTMYSSGMPKLWDDTIEAHRRAVRDATLDAAAALVAERGLRSVTMSEIAADTGIGRATLYKYFSDVDAILVAWHERQVAGHVAQLTQLSDRPGGAMKRLAAVLESYALIQHEHRGSELSALLHHGAHVARAQHHLAELVRGLLIECAKEGDVRDDVAADELANYCLHALTAAAGSPSKAAVRRLISVTMDALKQPVPRTEAA